MTKSVASEPNAEFKENDENQRVNEATAPETNVASDVASDGVAADGPTVTIKGVSGKKITGVVKVVKAKAKKEAPGQDEQQDTDAAEADPRTADAQGAPEKVDESRVKTAEVAAAKEETKPAGVVEEPGAKPEKKQGEPGKVGNILKCARPPRKKSERRKTSGPSRRRPPTRTRAPTRARAPTRSRSNVPPARVRIGRGRRYPRSGEGRSRVDQKRPRENRAPPAR